MEKATKPKAAKPKTKAAPEAVQLDHSKVFVVVALSDENRFVKGSEYSVAGVVAEVLINKGLVKLK